MKAEPELNVTLSAELLDHLRAESQRLEVPMEWLVASLIVDTLDEAGVEPPTSPTLRTSRRSPSDWEPALAG